MSIFIRTINLPSAVRGLTVPDVDGNYNVYVNAKLNYELQQITVHHEICHITNNDFESTEPVKEIENRVNSITQRE
jgi:hypothetical protein